MIDLNQQLNSSASLSLRDPCSSQWLFGLFVVADGSINFQPSSGLTNFSWLEVVFTRASFMLIVLVPQFGGLSIWQ